MKSTVDKLDVDKSAPVPVDLGKLSDVVKNDVVKKDLYNAKIQDIEDEIPDITNLTTNTTLNAKINEFKNKIPDIINLATLTAVENKIPDHSKHIATPEFNKLLAENFAARLEQAALASKYDTTNFVKKTDFDDKLKKSNQKINSNKTKPVLVENEFKKIETFDSNLFIGQSYFNDDGTQLYLILQPLYYTLKRLGDTEKVVSWKSKCLSAEKRTTPTTTDNSLSPSIKWYENINLNNI